MNIDALTAYLALSSGSYSGILRDMYAVHNLGLNPDLHTKLLANRFVGGTKELSGTPPLSFKSKGKPLTAWSITGNTVQNGTPTPDTPQEVKAVGDRTGNLFNLQSWTNTTTDTRSYFQLSITLYNGSTSLGECRFDVHETGRVALTSATAGADGATRLAIKHNGSTRDLAIGSVYDDFPANQPLTISFDVSGYDPTITGGISISNIMLNSGSTPLPYEPYGYKIPVVTRGKNLIDVANVTGNTNTLFTDNVNPKLAQVKFDEATQYTISMKFEIDTRLGWRKITFTYTDGTTSVSPWISTSGVFKYTSTSGKTIAKVEFTNYNYYGGVSVEYIQLEAGTEATEYEPYHEPITTPIYLDSPLYKIGDYADSINYAEQKVERVVKELVLTGKENWYYMPNYDVENTVRIHSSEILPDRKGTMLDLCSHFERMDYRSLNVSNKPAFSIASGTQLVFRVSKAEGSAVTYFKSYLAAQYAAGTPVKVYYVMQTPETESVTLPEIPTLNGTTVIDVDTVVKPESMTIKYRR